jgi:short chain dehydrogenase
MSVTEAFADKVLEATIVGSFSRIGYDVRSRLRHWDEPPSMKGRSVLITGATSGLGQAAATGLASLGATVRFVARDESRACVAQETIVAASGSDDVGYVIADMSDFDSVRAAAAPHAGPCGGARRNGAHRRIPTPRSLPSDQPPPASLEPVGSWPGGDSLVGGDVLPTFRPRPPGDGRGGL